MVWDELDPKVQRAIAGLLTRACRNNDKPTFAFNGPTTAATVLRPVGLAPSTTSLAPYMGGEKIALASVQELVNERVLSLAFVPISADLLRNKVRHIHMPINRAMTDLDGFPQFIERLAAVSEDQAMVEVKHQAQQAEQRALAEQQSVAAFHESGEWGEF